MCKKPETAVIAVRVPMQERERLQAPAAARQETLSELARRALAATATTGKVVQHATASE